MFSISIFNFNASKSFFERLFNNTLQNNTIFSKKLKSLTFPMSENNTGRTRTLATAAKKDPLASNSAAKVLHGGEEIFRATGMMPNHNFSELERLRHRSPSPMASANSLSNVSGTGLASWNGLQQEGLSRFTYLYLGCRPYHHWRG